MNWFEQEAVDYKLYEGCIVQQRKIVICLNKIEAFEEWEGGTMVYMVSGAKYFIAGNHQHNVSMIVHGRFYR